MPYLFIVFLAVGLLIVTIVAGKLASLATRNITIFGVPHSLGELSNYLLYTLGVGGEILILTAIYLVMPVGRLSLRHALMGGVTAGLLWEIARHLLAWYYGTMSQVRIVYGSLTTAILVVAASLYGLPVSTTHVSVGSLFGIGLTTRKANYPMINAIVLSWLVTLPVAAIASGATYWALQALPIHS